jgi:hypothetical protein
MNPVFIFCSSGFLLLASGYLLFKTRTQFLLYFLVILFSSAQIIGALMKVMHLPGADQILMVGILSTLFGAILLMITSIKNTSKELQSNKLILGLLILGQILIPLMLPEHTDVASLFNYPVTALCGTLLINKQSENVGEKNMLILFLLFGCFYIIFELIKRFH